MEAYQRLEADFGRWAKVDNVVACSSGTAALHLALESLQLPPLSECVVPDFAMIAVPRAVTLAGLTPVLVDCGSDLNMDMDALDEACSSGNVRAVIVQHTYGRQADMGAVTDLAAKYGIAVIEDLAEAHGIEPHPESAAACWSFYRNKIVAGEEGGAVAFREPNHAALARCLRSLGFTPAHNFEHVPRGHNYRLANSLATQILDSLERADGNLFLRRRIEQMYESVCAYEWHMPPRDVVWVYDLRIRGMRSEQQDVLIHALRCRGIEARHAFKPVSHQREYGACRVVGRGRAAKLSREVIYLPVVPGATTEESARLATAIIGETMATPAA